MEDAVRAAVALFALLTAVLGASPELDDARQLYHSLRYKAAEEKLSRARDSRALTRDERREVFDLLARCLAAQGRLDEAEQAYAELLAVDPDAPAPEGSAPKVMNAFRHAHERVVPQSPAAPPEPEPVVEAPPEPELVPSPAPRVEPAAVAVVASEPEPASLRWAGWGALGAAALATVAGIALGAAAAQDSDSAHRQHFASDAIALDRSAKDKAIAAHVLCAVAVVGAGTAGLVLWRFP